MQTLPTLYMATSSAREEGISLPTSTFSSRAAERTPWLWLLLLTVLTVALHGYHLGVDDAAIYVPGIKQVADPALYPFGAEFFESHAHLSLFPLIIGSAARLTHVPVDVVIFACYVAGTFLLLLASWRLLSICFTTSAARWGGVTLLAAVLVVPVAGTALMIADPYVTARTLSTPATIFAIACFLVGDWKRAVAWWLFTASIHPQMSVYAGLFLASLALVNSLRRPVPELAEAQPSLAYYSGIPFLFAFEPAHGAAREALFSRAYFFVTQWAWYEWVGVFAPLAILWWFSTKSFRGATAAFRTIAQTLVPFGLLFTIASLILTMHPRLENYTRLQPMRSLHLTYILFFLFLGALMGEYVLGHRLWHWAALLLPLAAGMYAVQFATYPASAHIEWPGATPDNHWTAAFLWIRTHTPKDAVFALNPDYLLSPGEDMHGFRAVAERSVLADAVKDSGAVSLFPDLADRWQAQVQSVQGWKHFEAQDFQRLAQQYPVTWVVTDNPPPTGLTCPYQNSQVTVCRITAMR